ncbi:putative DNA binding protein [Caldisphaera lagunensis DSM 15908]|uniref:Putative DNA binding protein n=1 Tax=Caldisphaera lagunensis (strain DSM 15908 / JCM 11604 / ANMR 0165 / IC-154) TaxID=1056495 RepID=L0A7Z8_CALLD|nr:helix-turn-helix domain-containing protein [Caldisphaera lagunensis]AFZ69956.1 putative DNA binding protein [Caldisphaera lagunensis DSM 15908]
MLILDLTVKSDCGLSKISHDINQEILSLSVFPINEKLNSVTIMLKLLERGSDYELKRWKVRYSDFTKFDLNKIGKSTFIINGVKEGHGIVKTLVKYDSALLMPTIAGDNYERFLILLKNKKNLDSFIKEITSGNKILNIDYNEASTGIIISWMSKVLLDVGNISKREYEVLYNAYKYGYFNWPRKINVDALSKKLEISQPNLLYHLRNSIYKLLSNILSDS